jgi:hypothetical protein
MGLKPKELPLEFLYVEKDLRGILPAGMHLELQKMSDDDMYAMPLEYLKRTKAATPKKPHRNAPCPCGSGKKYKRCCGRGYF